MKITRSGTRQAQSPLFQSLLRYAASLLSFALISVTAQNASDATRSFQEGRYDDALEIYRQLSLENPDDARYTYNAGVAAYKAGQLTEAIDQFEAASLAPDLEIQQQAHYNLGNTFFRAGESTDDFEQKSAAWKQAVQRYQHALTINEADNLAQDNLDFVKQRIEELEQQQEQQQQDQDQNQENENEESEQDQSSESDSEQDQDQDQESSDQQDNQQDQNQENQDQQQQNENEQQQNQNQNQNGEQEQEEQQQQDPSEQQQSEQNPDQQDPSKANQPQEGKMTPEQAKQLLDAERDQAKAMIFRPPVDKKSRTRRFKDW